MVGQVEFEGHTTRATATLSPSESSYVVMLAGEKDLYSVNCSVSHLLGAGCQAQLAVNQTCEDECRRWVGVVDAMAKVQLHGYIVLHLLTRTQAWSWRDATIKFV